MRHASVVLRTSVAVIVAMSVGACAAASTSPSSRATAPAASASVSPRVQRTPSCRQRNRRVRLRRRLRHPGRGEDRRPDPGRRPRRTALVRCRRHVALGPPAHEPGPRGPGVVRRHGTDPPALDGVRLRHDRRRFHLADGQRERHPREDRPGHGQGGHADPGRGGTGRRRRHRGLGVGGQRAQRVGPAHRSNDQQGCRDDPGRADRTEWAADHVGWTRRCLGGDPAHG